MERKSWATEEAVYVGVSLVLARLLRHVATSTFIGTEGG